MRRILFTSFVFLLLLIPVSGFTVRGKIADEMGCGIPAAHIYVPEKRIGASADLDGNYLMAVVDGAESITFSRLHFQATAIGYSQRDTFITLTSDTVINITLFSQALMAEPVIVSASRVEQRLLDAPMTTTVASGDAIKSKAITGFDEAIRYIPGITMSKYQVSVRNSSGYAHGAGSRVTMMIDGVPIVAGDTGEIKWDSLPTSAITQVEVVKGAGSSLYGSGALGGAINIVTEMPKERKLKLRMKFGAYDDPYWEEWKWTDKLNTIKSIGLQWEDKLSSVAYLITTDITQNDNYREADDFERGKVFTKLHWDISHNRSLSAFINAAYEDRGTYFEWKSQAEALRLDSLNRNDRVWSSKLFSAVTFRGDSPAKHLFFNGKLYNIFNTWSSRIFNPDSLKDEIEYSTSDKVGIDSQVMFTWGKQLFTLGTEGCFSAIASKMFSNHFGAGGAFFAQDEVSNLHPLVLTIGARLDAFWVDSAAVDFFFGASPKISAVYHFSENAAARTSISSGFRIPTMSELFVRTTAGGILQIQPNINLLPEQGYTAEIGGNYVHDGFLLDGAVFYNYYSDMIEPVAGAGGSFNDVEFKNLRQVQILGTEITAKWAWRTIALSANYLFTNSSDLDTDEKLPYRPDHSVTFSADWGIWRYITLSTDWRYKSKMEYALYRADVRVDQKVLDLQLKLNYNPVDLAFRVNNVLNYNYTELERNISPIRHFVVAAEVSIF